jgi:ABC-2 type transport system permease protein
MVFFFVLISASSLTLYRMFQAKDLPFIMSLPIRDRLLFEAKFAESLSDLFRSMILTFPVCLAFISVIYHISPLSTVIFLIGWILVMIQLASISVIIALILGKIVILSRWSILLRFIAVIAIMSFLLAFLSYVNRADVGSTKINEEIMEKGPVSSSIFRPLIIIFPTTWLVKALPYGEFTMDFRVIYGFGFVFITLILLISAFYIFKSRFRYIWSVSVEVKSASSSQKSLKRKKPSVSKAMGNTLAIVLKEMRVTWREPHLWSGLIIPLVMIPVFIFLRSYDQGTQEVYVIIVCLLSTASYSLSSIGREGRSFFMIRSLPVRMFTLLRAKFLVGCAVNLALTLIFASALYMARRSSLDQMWRNVLIAVVSSVYLSAFGVGLSALFPKFDYTNPMKAASLPGMLALYLIVFIFGFTFIGVAKVRWYLVPLLLVPWTVIAFVLIKMGVNKLEKMDI